MKEIMKLNCLLRAEISERYAKSNECPGPKMAYFLGEVHVYDRQYRFMDDSFTNGQTGILPVLNCVNTESGVKE